MHGYGFVTKPKGNVTGFFIQLPNEKSIYSSSVTIYIDTVDKVLKEYKPVIRVVAFGTAQLDIFKPLLMTMAEIIRFVQNSPDKVITNHLEAVNHCPTTGEQLRSKLTTYGVLGKAYVPQDGEMIEFE